MQEDDGTTTTEIAARNEGSMLVEKKEINLGLEFLKFSSVNL